MKSPRDFVSGMLCTVGIVIATIGIIFLYKSGVGRDMATIALEEFIMGIVFFCLGVGMATVCWLSTEPCYVKPLPPPEEKV